MEVGILTHIGRALVLFPDLHSLVLNMTTLSPVIVTLVVIPTIPLSLPLTRVFLWAIMVVGGLKALQLFFGDEVPIVHPLLMIDLGR